MDSVKDLLKLEFKVTDMGDLHWLLGIRIEYDNSGIVLSQTAYIDKIIKCFGLQDANSVTYSLDKNHLLNKGKETRETTESSISLDPVKIKLYQQIIGSLMYTVTGTRPDLAYTVTRLSQYLTKPTNQHIGAAKHVLQYLKGTRDMKLSNPYKQQNAETQDAEISDSLILEGYCDSNHGGCPETRRSTSGYAFKLAGCTISWRSRK